MLDLSKIIVDQEGVDGGSMIRIRGTLTVAVDTFWHPMLFTGYSAAERIRAEALRQARAEIWRLVYREVWDATQEVRHALRERDLSKAMQKWSVLSALLCEPDPKLEKG